MTRFLAGTRLLVIVPVIGLALAASLFFVLGGIGLISLIVSLFLESLTELERTSRGQDLPVAVEVVEYVHQFLIGTVLYITAIGLFQLFIHEVSLPEWLQIDSTEQLETNLIGVTVVVLAVHFLSVVFTSTADELLRYGAGIALPIAALALFVGLRTWSTVVEQRDERARRASRDAGHETRLREREGNGQEEDET